MPKGYNLGDLRAAIDDVTRSVAEESKCGEAQNDRVLARLKSERQPLISAFTPQLVDMALTKLLNDVCKKSASTVGHSGEVDLFGEYGKIPKRVTVARGLKKDTANLSISEARKWLEKRSNRPTETDHEDFQKLIDRVAPHALSDDETISDVLHRISQNGHGNSQEFFLLD